MNKLLRFWLNENTDNMFNYIVNLLHRTFTSSSRKNSENKQHEGYNEENNLKKFINDIEEKDIEYLIFKCLNTNYVIVNEDRIPLGNLTIEIIHNYKDTLINIIKKEMRLATQERMEYILGSGIKQDSEVFVIKKQIYIRVLEIIKE